MEKYFKVYERHSWHNSVLRTAETSRTISLRIRAYAGKPDLQLTFMAEGLHCIRPIGKIREIGLYSVGIIDGTEPFFGCSFVDGK